MIAREGEGISKELGLVIIGTFWRHTSTSYYALGLNCMLGWLLGKSIIVIVLGPVDPWNPRYIE